MKIEPNLNDKIFPGSSGAGQVPSFDCLAENSASARFLGRDG